MHSERRATTSSEGTAAPLLVLPDRLEWRTTRQSDRGPLSALAHSRHVSASRTCRHGGGCAHKHRGGVAGGDRLHNTVTAFANASLTVTSQAAERIYRARTAARATVFPTRCVEPNFVHKSFRCHGNESFGYGLLVTSSMLAIIYFLGLRWFTSPLAVVLPDVREAECVVSGFTTATYSDLFQRSGRRPLRDARGG